ncbi:cold-shock protein [Streptomyces sp. NPDC058655]|uniref:cold-shock protein n=1 Tax=Streptomyces sp. NPDC058655 TaxID=3346577 RepID=UPI00364FAB2B
MNTRQIGEVKSFNVDKMFGFIKPYGEGDDVFCHISGFAYGTRPSDVKAGMRVTFEVEDSGDRGSAAVHIEIESEYVA